MGRESGGRRERKERKGRGGVITLVITILVIGLIGTLAFIAVDRAITTQQLDRSYINPWTAQHAVLYPCKFYAGEEEYQTQLCLIHSDGTGQRQLTFDEAAGVSYTQPQINSSGQIVTRCQNLQLDTSPICLMHIDGPDAPIRIGSAERVNARPAINNRGDVLYKCASRTRFNELDWAICRASPENIEGEVLPLSHSPTGSGPLALNDRGWLLYHCEAEARASICLFNFQTSENRLLKANELDSIEIDIEGNLEMNNRGEIAIDCVDVERERNSICVSNFESSEYELLEIPNAGSAVIGYSLGDLTDSGRLAMSCEVANGGERETEICLVDHDGRGFEVLTERPAYAENIEPAINMAGAIAYRCDETICVIDAEGLYFRELVETGVFAGEGYPAIQ